MAAKPLKGTINTFEMENTKRGVISYSKRLKSLAEQKDGDYCAVAKVEAYIKSDPSNLHVPFDDLYEPI